MTEGVVTQDKVTFSASHTIPGLPWKLFQLFTVYKAQVCLIHKQYVPCFKEIFSFNKEKEKKKSNVNRLLGTLKFIVCLVVLLNCPDMSFYQCSCFTFFRFYSLYSQISIPFVLANEVYEISILEF